MRHLYRQLRLEGFLPWLDEEDLLPGQDWRAEVSKAVRQADAVLVCLSNLSVTKEGYVQKEIREALDVADEKPDNTIFLIPVRLELCTVPERLRRWHWVDAFETGGYAKLAGALQARAETLFLRNSVTNENLTAMPDATSHRSPMVGEFKVRKVLNTNVIDFVGRIPTGDGATVLGNLIRDLAEEGNLNLILNFDGTAYVDELLVGELVSSYTMTRNHGGLLKLLKPPKRLRALLQIAQVHSVFEIFDDELDAVHSFGIYADRETKLMWTVYDNDKNINWREANEYAKQLRLGGFSDWRLPTIDEIEKLYFHPYPRPSGWGYDIRKPFRVKNPWMWSSSLSESKWAWVFSFNGYGRMLHLIEHPRAALCVRHSAD